MVSNNATILVAVTTDPAAWHLEKIATFFHTRWPIPEGDAGPVPEENNDG